VGVLEDQALIDWLRTAASNCKWQGHQHGLGFRDYLRALGVTVVSDRVVWEGTHISCAGVSAGIDMALALTERVHGRELAEALQLVIEYDPEPPFDSGSVEKASTKTRRLATASCSVIARCGRRPGSVGRWCGRESAVRVTRSPRGA
jgi:hypothetical protein